MASITKILTINNAKISSVKRVARRTYLVKSKKAAIEQYPRSQTLDHAYNVRKGAPMLFDIWNSAVDNARTGPVDPITHYHRPAI